VEESNVNDIRTNELIDAFFNCDLEGDDRLALERLLLQSPQARAIFWRKAEIHEELRDWGLEQWDRIGSPQLPGPRRMPLARLLFGAGRAARAAAYPLTLLVGWLVGMSVAWAMLPQSRPAVSIPLELANGGFEDDSATAISPAQGVDRLERLQTAYGVWTGDRVRVCEAEQGVTPAEGSHMLALERALPGPGDPADTRADSCDLFQVVDLAAHRDQIAKGGCTLTASAQLIDAGPQRPVATDFVVRVYVFSGLPETPLAGWPQTRLEALATGTERVTSFGGQKAWREIATQSGLPKDASFLILQIDATNMDRTPGRPAAVFERHYCDKVRVTLHVPSDQMSGN
jgi:hypothetical protein